MKELTGLINKQIAQLLEISAILRSQCTPEISDWSKNRQFVKKRIKKFQVNLS
jgi:hypothetical protein